MVDITGILNLMGSIGDTLLKLLGVVFIIYLIFKYLVGTFELCKSIFNFFKLSVYYPIAIKITKQKHKSYVREVLRSFTSPRKADREAALLGLSYEVDLEWSDEERIEFDYERGALIVKIPYARELYRIIAKALVMVAPYAISEYLEPVLGPKLARTLTLSIAEDYASRDINVLSEFRNYIDEIYESDEEFKELLIYIHKAEDQSLFKHIVLRELKEVLRKFNGKINKDKLEEDIEELIKMVGTLPETERAWVCGNYISLAIVRVGKLAKVIFREWDRYIQYVKTCLQKCPNLSRIYMVSAGSLLIRTKLDEKLIEYLESNVEGLKFVDCERYKARLYKGKSNVPQLVAVFEIQS